MPEHVPETNTFNHIFTELSSLLPAALGVSVEVCSDHLPNSLPTHLEDSPQFRSLINLFLFTSLLNARSDSPIEVNAKESATSIDLTFKVDPNPMFMLLSKWLRDPLDKMTASAQRSPDSVVAFLMARKLAESQFVNLWIEAEGSSSSLIHAYFLKNRPRLVPEGKKPSVLVIEDNKQISLLMELYLKNEGFETFTALNGIDGLKHAGSNRPDLITLDVMMPEMDGWQVLRELKMKPNTADIPVIIVSVLRDVQIGYEFGASDYLTKPVDHHQLIANARRLCNGQPAASRALSALPSRITLLVSTDSGADNMAKALIPAQIKTVSSAQAVSSLDLNGSAAPDCIVVDCTANIAHILTLLYRFRLDKKYDHVPVVAIADAVVAEYLSRYFNGVIDAVIPSHEVSLETLRRAFPAA